LFLICFISRDKLTLVKELIQIGIFIIMKAIVQQNPCKGKLLLSKPLMKDDFFHNAVILLTEYDESGVVGFIINKPVNLSLIDLLDDFPEFDAPVYYGGPVSSDNLYFIHRVPEMIEDSIHIINDLYWGGNFDQVVELIEQKELNENDIRFFLGYSGWDSEQLELELVDDSWIIDEMDNSLFDWDVVSLWKKRLKEQGDKYQLWANAPEDIRLN